MTEPSPLEECVREFRAFNRYYTNITGLLRERLLDTPYSLTEARVIFELAQRETTELADLRRSLDIDAGYTTRILDRFEQAGLVTRERSEADGRRQVVRPTAKGRATFADLDARSAAEARGRLAGLAGDEQRQLVAAQRAIRDVLDGAAAEPATLVQPRPGDLGWVVERHGALYAEEYGFDRTFEALVAGILGEFGARDDDGSERGWIAVRGGVRLGCVFCMRKDGETAQLRLLLVEPAARGSGVGSKLVDECVRFAREAGYRRLSLWTNDVLVDARRLYERAGFCLDEEERHTSFGQKLVGQYWSLGL